MKAIKNYLFLFTIASVLVALDQGTKNLVRANIPTGGTWLPEGWQNLAPYARAVHWHNRGAAFGMFQNGALVFTVLAFVVIIAIIWFYHQIEPNDWFLRLALAMQLAGAAGNLTDRLLFDGTVTDWISVGNFAVFNVADASITVGTAIMLIGVWIMEKREKQARAESDSQNGLETEPHLSAEDSI
ncbi:MAG: signal peptidase II [Anaerolineae bacterium]|nr:signal peptidase II [Anaerolineae bacterium]MBT4309836.1 signal peptidase II [Anaerolineae bacterium]MBT4460277.1 signal peptidase II [Anaerolineae bacterium]MBT6060051.1 signal peptidase II [Anaerolineae bacterium]MBT6324178.1 signal peptidase II [Anaerolineae bacterium]